MDLRRGLGCTVLLKLLGLVFMGWALSVAAPQQASAWDAGTSSRTHDEGSGGENPISILDTRPKWAESSAPNSSRVSDCPSGYVNTGVTCYREPYIYSAPSILATCPSGYTNTGVSCYREPYIYSAPSILATCPSGYTNTGVSCYREPYIYSAPSILATCPSGYTNTGVSCFRGADSFSAPSNSGSCPAGYVDFGLYCNWGSFPYIGTADHICAAGYFLSAGLCHKTCPAGYTNTGETCYRGPSTISLSSATCPNGYFHGLVASRCNKTCNTGFTNTGEFCQRDADTISLSNATCPSGYSQGLIASRCNETCNTGFTNTGDFCQRDADTISLSNATCPSGYFQGLIASRCNETCNAGFTNTGEFCQRDAHTLSTESMTCLPTEEKIEILGVPRCYTKPVCSSGYEYFLGLCYVTPVATGQGGAVERTAISTVVHHVKQSGNTHLWIVKQALSLLAKSGEPGAAEFVAKMESPAIQQQWEQGIWDGDSLSYVDFDSVGSSHNHQGTHFYNATGLDRTGDPTSIVTYFGASDNSFSCTNSRECAAAQLTGVNGYALGQTNPQTTKAVAYHLGVALHYMTDATQPMHTSGWYGASIPINGHPQWEYYVPYVQALFPSTSMTWDKLGLDLQFEGLDLDNPDVVFNQAAIKSNGFAPRLSNALHIAGDAGIVTIEAFNGIGPYTGFNFYDDPNVDALTGEILQDAYQSTATYLHAVYKTVLSEVPKTCDEDGDADGDQICDSADNCTLVANANQLDTDLDGYGNRCDPDFDNNGVVNFSDLSQLKAAFFGTAANEDLDGNRVVNFADLSIMKAFFFKAPGPSGLACAGHAPCSASSP